MKFTALACTNFSVLIQNVGKIFLLFAIFNLIKYQLP